MRRSGLLSEPSKGFPPPIVRLRGLKLKTKIEKREAVLAAPGQKPGIFGARALALRALENGCPILREHRARPHFRATRGAALARRSGPPVRQTLRHAQSFLGCVQ